MKVHACATTQDDGLIVGKACPSALIVFGPYVRVPSNADVRLTFDISSPNALKVRSDIVSEGARQFHGALDEQTIPPDETRTLSYRIHVFDDVRALETRIGISTLTPVTFTVSNLELSVQ